MADETAPPGAAVAVQENPHTDAVTRAYSAYDSAKEIADLSDDEIERLHTKLERAKADVEGAKQALADAQTAKGERAAALKTAKAALDEALAADPESAEAAAARRKLTHDAAVREARATLARLTGKE